MTEILAGSLCDSGPPRPGWLAIDGGTIVDRGDGAPATRALEVPWLLAPGFVDVQVNGVGTVDFVDADPDGWSRAGRFLVSRGVTAYLPTIVTAPLAHYEPALRRVDRARARAAGEPHAQIIGAHLEGPFLGGAPGAHPVELIVPADASWLGALLDVVPETVRLVTLAPEADPDGIAIRELVRRDVAVSLGHSTASYAEAITAADAGATLVTHAFNGMPSLHHREPGLVGAALDDFRLTPTVIPDLVHVHPAVLRLVSRTKPNVAVVTDAVAGTAGPDGAVRLADGRLAGTTVTMDQGVRNLVGVGIPVERAIAMTSTVPAAALGLSDRGRLDVGCRADIVALDPTALTVAAVWLAGVRVVGAADVDGGAAG